MVSPLTRTPPNLYGRNRWRGMTAGILGGSFNPAHEGHLHLSEAALKRLRLDTVWWLVSPGNPLKDKAGMAPLEKRLASARHIAKHPRIVVSALESLLGTRYTADTLKRLRRRYPETRFVFLAGADNLAQFHLWKRWERIFSSVPVAIIDRPGYTLTALNAKAARKFSHSRKDGRLGAAVRRGQTPAWGFLTVPRHGASATAIRAESGWISRSENKT